MTPVLCRKLVISASQKCGFKFQTLRRIYKYREASVNHFSANSILDTLAWAFVREEGAEREGVLSGSDVIRERA